MMMLKNKACLIAAPYSGSGKTLITMCLLRYFARQTDITITAGKSGPDYIDTQFHARAINAPINRKNAFNFDSWAMRADSLMAIRALAADNFLLIEGAMGLYDGAGASTKGSSAHLANTLNIPIILILPVQKQARSICAMLQGYLNYLPDTDIIGVILNGVGSDRHRDIISTALAEDFPDLPILGALPRRDEWHLPSRHLGLTQPGAMPEFDSKLDTITDEIMPYINVDLLIDTIAKDNKSNIITNNANTSPLINLRGIKHIAIAYDEAFRFIYHAQILIWQQQNITVSFFSILKNEAPNVGADMIFLPGGYPELFAGIISQAQNSLQALHRAQQNGAWIYGECGGYMVLGQNLIDGTGKQHAMAGLLDHSTDMQRAKRHLGYRICHINGETPFMQKQFTAHEFHYSTETTANPIPLFDSVTDADGNILAKKSGGTILPYAGGRKGKVMGSYMHLIDEIC